uniref:Uncharacterized protein n=1 Tax=Arundo donax TaxID=35708 RepID=A0A0A9H8X6_ARUDO
MGPDHLNPNGSKAHKAQLLFPPASQVVPE